MSSTASTPDRPIESIDHASMNIGIVGAGIMGRLLGWQLQTSGYQVTLFDKDPIDCGTAAAYTAAGMLAPYSELESAEDVVYQLGQRSLVLWPQWIEQLEAQHYFHQAGSLVVAHPQDTADLEHFNQTLKHKLPDHQDIAYLNQQQLRELEPELASHFQSATSLQGESWVYTKEIMATLAHRLMSAGANWYAETTVSHVEPGSITTDCGSYQFDCVIDCRGLGAKPDIAKLRGVRGEVIHVQAPEVNLKRMVRLMHPRYRLYLVPRDNHHYILGATQIESEDTSGISVRSALELLSALYAIHPGFAEARVVETLTNCRPALLDNLPAIHKQDGLIQVNGLYRHGYLLAPALAEQVVATLEGSGKTAPDFSEIFHTL
ncbi:MAG: glycine oxidase ThiO [Candidatus Pelagadaptatus aseana]|uniref:glycine oxidase ThiO n=1 Tax=Candidatus Pelagadaptatus aseana TaxID=3120508 RepID=UPI0039B1931C